VNRCEQEALMLHYDGELPPPEAALWLARLESDAESRAVFDGLQLVGDAVRALAAVDGPGADGIADRVMQRIHGAQAAEPRHWPRLRAVAGLGGALALAACLALWLHAGPRGTAALPSPAAVLSAPLAAVLEPQATSSAPDPAADEADSAPTVAIEAVDFGARNGSIFMVPTGDTATPVVWVMDDPAPGEGRMERL
jgi:negative regulator of sigma E activity